MTYSAFGATYKRNPTFIKSFDLIVCDEIHTLNSYIGMQRSQLQLSHSNLTDMQLEEALYNVCYPYVAITEIAAAIDSRDKWVFGLTATPMQLHKNYLRPLGDRIHEVEYTGQLETYTQNRTIEYNSLDSIIRAQVPTNRKRLFYFTTIKQMLKCKQELEAQGRAAEAIWALSNAQTMSDHQLAVRAHLLEHHTFPPEVQDLIINSAYETALTIVDPVVQEVYIHTTNADTRVQARSRLRQNLDIVGYYNKKK